MKLLISQLSSDLALLKMGGLNLKVAVNFKQLM